MKRPALLYVRPSVGSPSAAEQEALLRAFAEGQGVAVAGCLREPPLSRRGRRDGLRARDRLLSEALRRGASAIAVCTVDRLGRDLTDLVVVLGRLEAASIEVLVADDGSAAASKVHLLDAARRTYQQEAIVEGRRAARARGVRFGRPPVGEERIARVRSLLGDGVGIRAAARACGVSPATVIRVRDGVLPRPG